MLYNQVYDYVLNRIVRQEWKEHDKLPSVRMLAEELQVHRLTVLRAYQLLKENGKVYVKDKSGYYVQPGYQMPQEQLDYPIVASYVQKNHLSEIHNISATYQLSKALIDPALLPNHFFSEQMKRVFDLYPKVMSTYASVQGDEELREALARYLSLQHRFYSTAEHILITSGAQQAIDLVARVLIKPRDPVLIEQPTYSAAIDVFREQGATLIPVEIQPEGYDLEQVETLMKQHKPRLFYMNPTFHNPTGYTVPSENRKKLVELAERYRCVLVDDDSYHDTYFGEKPPPPLLSYDTEGWVMYIRGFSKYVAPGLRIAAVVCRPPLMKHLLTVKSLIDNGTPLLNQKIFLHYFSSERVQQHLEKLRIALAIRKSTMEEALASTGFRWTSPQGGLNLWVELPSHIPMDQLLAQSIANSITFVPGSICDPLVRPSSRVRLSFSYVNEQKLRDGIKLWLSLPVFQR